MVDNDIFEARCLRHEVLAKFIPHIGTSDLTAEKSKILLKLICPKPKATWAIVTTEKAQQLLPFLIALNGPHGLTVLKALLLKHGYPLNTFEE